MIHKRLLIFAAAILFTASSFAQILEFDKTKYDLGTIAENDSTATISFAFCNAGTDTINIRRVEAPCSINIVHFPDTVCPDMADKIDLVLDVSNLSGRFAKKILVYGNFETFALDIYGRKRSSINFDDDTQEEVSADEDNDKPAKKKNKKRKSKKDKKRSQDDSDTDLSDDGALDML